MLITKKFLLFLLFKNGTTSESIHLIPGTPGGLRLIPAIILSLLITAIGFLGMSYFLHLVNYPCFEQWLW